MLDGAVLRTSLVFGHGGDSSALFMQLARLPLLCLPGPVQNAQVQPLAVQDLAAAVAALLGQAQDRKGLLELAGPKALKLQDFIASLRTQRGHQPARVIRLPDVLTRYSAKLGDAIPLVPWCSETLALLATDNTADASVLAGLLQRPAIHFTQLVQQAWSA